MHPFHVRRRYRFFPLGGTGVESTAVRKEYAYSRNALRLTESRPKMTEGMLSFSALKRSQLEYPICFRRRSIVADRSRQSLPSIDFALDYAKPSSWEHSGLPGSCATKNGSHLVGHF